MTDDDTTAPPTTPPSGGGQARLLVAAVVLAVVVAVVAVLVTLAVTGDDDDTSAPDGEAAASRGSGVTVPYDDTRATGLITLCNDDGTAVTGGNVDDKPLADIVVGSTALASSYDPAGAGVTLFGYQPRAGISPAEFSGTIVSAQGPIVETGTPAVRVTDDAYSVGDFVTIFPATQDGFVQLRLVFGTTEAGQITDAYDVADLRVDGDTWELVRGGGASCADAASLVPPTS